ncbi:MAG TPA: LysM peptidoglycan-binding domain-containing protein [Kiritimatiellia bacterium]|nr:LysM peptidoglycan-binding domain-containing protein [Kiritimatiellia bacterium]HRZ11906.1 LysM peptidoglycan-binding domain-containing protein [Kiritimatiellia bacterium]HSA17288.1 LysM peptidoglycan-binding domain-containing protein [Kiritimatiellia bacterium]
MRKGMRWIGGLGLVLLMAAGGCSRSAGSLDQMEERDPLLKRARERKNQQDVDGAIELFNKALERKPNLARAHLEVGHLYDSQKQDYIRALYHYQRYLELRPQTEKRPVVEDLIRHARVRFASTLPAQPSGAIEEIALLRQEIEALRARLGEAAKAVPAAAAAATAAAAPAAAQVAGAPRPPEPAPAQPPMSTYIVQPGDNLSRIAERMYGNSGRWSDIYEANRSTLKSPESVRVGQTLVIPK